MDGKPLLFNEKTPDQSQPDQQIPNQQQQNQNLRLWVTSIDDYTSLKTILRNIKKRNFTYSADNMQFKLDNTGNLLISVNLLIKVLQKSTLKIL